MSSPASIARRRVARILSVPVRPSSTRPSHLTVLSRRTLSSTVPFLQPAAQTPSSSAAPYLITTPIFYVNAVPHVGHLHSMLLADTLARFARLQDPQRTVHFCTGTDEHGLKIQNAARDTGMSPKAMCDKNSQRFKDLAEAANISYTTFIRTTEERHKVAVQHFWNRLVEGGHIYKGSHSGWYAVSDECFYTEQQIKDAEDGSGGKVSIESGAKVEWTDEDNYKFRLSSFREALIEWLKTNPQTVTPAHYQALLQTELNSDSPPTDLSISRPSSRLTWGIPVPGDTDHTIYVWVDALINYITVLGYPGSSPSSAWDSLQAGWPADVQIVGKDIVRFHALYWPALLMAVGLPPPNQVLVHAHWLQGNQKMSKSRGNVADPFQAIERAGVDSVRAYLMGTGGRLREDSDYSYAALLMQHKHMSDQIGNLLSRVSSKKVVARLLTLDTESPFPAEVIVSPEEPDAELDASMRVVRDKVEAAMLDQNPGLAFMTVMGLMSDANRLYQDRTPWVADRPSLHQAVVYSLHSLRMAAILLSPIMPAKMEELLSSMGVPAEERTWESAVWDGKSAGGGVLVKRLVEGMEQRKKDGKPKVLFERIEEVVE